MPRSYCSVLQPSLDLPIRSAMPQVRHSAWPRHTPAPFAPNTTGLQSALSENEFLRICYAYSIKTGLFCTSRDSRHDCQYRPFAPFTVRDRQVLSTFSHVSITPSSARHMPRPTPRNARLTRNLGNCQPSSAVTSHAHSSIWRFVTEQLAIWLAKRSGLSTAPCTQPN